MNAKSFFVRFSGLQLKQIKYFLGGGGDWESDFKGIILLKMDLSWVFSCEIWKNLNVAFLIEHLQTIAFVIMVSNFSWHEEAVTHKNHMQWINIVNKHILPCY